MTMAQSLEKILNLAKKTGDNVIVFDPVNPDDSYVILAIKSYERLLEEAGGLTSLTDDALADKINRDIDWWKNDWQEENESFLPDFAPVDAADLEDEWEEEVNYLYPTENEFAATPANQEPAAGDSFDSISDILRQRQNGRGTWAIPPERQAGENDL